MNRKKKTFTPNMRMAALYLLMGVLLLLAVTLFSGQESMRATEDYFARTISFVKCSPPASKNITTPSPQRHCAGWRWRCGSWLKMMP